MFCAFLRPSVEYLQKRSLKVFVLVSPLFLIIHPNERRPRTKPNFSLLGSITNIGKIWQDLLHGLIDAETRENEFFLSWGHFVCCVTNLSNKLNISGKLEVFLENFSVFFPEAFSELLWAYKSFQESFSRSF